MSATPADIKVWLNEGKRKRAKYVIVCHDGFDMGDFPKYVGENDKFWEVCPPRWSSISTISTTAHEIYDLSMDIEAQLKEPRAWHPPVRV